MLSQLVQSTSQMIESSDEHLAALANPLPTTVFVVLALVTAVALGAVGFNCGLQRRMSWLALLIMPLLLAVVILLIFDISYPRIGIVHVRDPILARLKRSF
jgi:membrane protein YdbS with pleckstrin-like domain